MDLRRGQFIVLLGEYEQHGLIALVFQLRREVVARSCVGYGFLLDFNLSLWRRHSAIVPVQCIDTDNTLVAIEQFCHAAS